MPSVFDSFPRASFNGIEFPVESSRIKGGLRDHVHYYSHSPGGSPEKLGRELYEFTVQVNFDARFTAYPGLYPNSLDQLQQFFETQTTGSFRLPQMPSAVPAYCRGWTREMNNRIRSGEKVELVFIEDQSNLFLFQDLVSNASANLTLGALANPSQFLPVPSLSLAALIGQVSLFIGQIQGLAQTVSVYGTELSNAVDGLINACASLDDDDQMQGVPAAAMMEANHELWAAAQNMANDIQGQGIQLQKWVVPVQMDIGRISVAIYKDSSRAGDLLSLNDVPDPLLVQAGTPLWYYPTA